MSRDDFPPAKVKTAADSISELAAFCRGTSPTIAARGVLPHERVALLNTIALVDAWVAGFVVALSHEPSPTATV
jgi:hypothetical protein